MLFLASLSNVHCSKGLFIIGKRIFGLVQLIGLNLVPKPPAKIKAFNKFSPFVNCKLIFNRPFNINDFIKVKSLEGYAP